MRGFTVLYPDKMNATTAAKTGFNSQLVFLFVYIYSAFVLIRPHEYIPALMGKPILPVLLILGTAIWLIFGRKCFFVSQHKLILVLLVIVSLSPLLQGWAGGILIAFEEFYPIVVFYLLLVGSMDSSRKIRAFYWLMTSAAVIMSLHGIGQERNGVGWSGAVPVMDGRITYVGIFNDPNDLGNLFVATLPMMVYLYSYYKSFIVKISLLAAMFTTFYGIYLTNSRGALLGVAGMCWVYLAGKFGIVRAVIVSTFFLPIVLLAPSRMREISANEESAAGRVDAWFAGLQMLTGSKFLGVGYGGFVDHHNLTAHNSFVLIFAELGIIGYFVWLAFLFLSLVMAFTMMKQAMGRAREERTESEALAFPVFYSLIGFCVTAFFLSRSYNILLYLLCALSVANYVNSNDVVTVTLSRYFGLIAKLTIGSILFFFVIVKVLLNV